MARTAHRTLIISAAFALASWALAAGAPVLAAAPAEQAGPSLPPAEYKPLPVGTKVTYDTWSYTVTKSDGYDITYKTNSGDWRHDYAVFGRHGDGAYGMSSEWKASLNDENKAALESFWPPKVGNKIVLNLEDEIPQLSAYVGESTRNWTVTLEVLGTAFLDLNSFRYPTYVIREHAISELVSSYETEISALEYSETKWYNSESGLILKSVKDWTRGPKKGEQEEYSLVRVRFPPGTKTNVLAGTTIPAGAGAGSDARLTAEVARLKREAEAKQKAMEALEAVKGSGSEELRRQREEQKRLMAQVARLTEEAEERRRAEEKRKAEKEARLKAEAERQRKAKVATRAAAPASDLQRQIAVLKQLRDGGLITGREFDFRKKGLLDRFVGAPKTATARLTAPKSPAAVLQARLAKYSGINFGRYYALVIGNNEYKHLPNLKTAADDARAVADILRDTYDFKVTLLINATRADIVDALDDFREKLDDTTNLLIYYAGHGWLDEGADQGYWLPVDAKSNRRSKWVANSTITGALRALNAKHVMVVADSCYSGTLIRGIKIKENTPDYIRRMAGKRARLALTSGGLEPVADSGGGKHSPFAAAFIDVLKANTSVIDGTQMFSQMRRPVILNADQTPQYSDVRRAGHEGGDFLFVRRR
ncbi:MAG: caspase family protein [Proteobacteria bacterium]|nr:caspase family protein [Pseudomonadota bacterium]